MENTKRNTSKVYQKVFYPEFKTKHEYEVFIAGVTFGAMVSNDAVNMTLNESIKFLRKIEEGCKE